MTDLRNALRDLADAEPLAPLGSDLWERGRASRRTPLLPVAACVAVLAILVGLGFAGRAWVTAEPALPLSDVPDGGALPATLHPPEGPAAQWGHQDGGHGDLAPTDGFERIGRVAGIRSRPGLLPVVVSAETGRHWLPLLPDQTADIGLGDPISISPDGWRIAYPWVVTGETTAKTRAGLAVLELRTGDVTRIDLAGRNGRPIRIDEVSWSADGTHLGWIGDEVVSWDDGGWSSRGRVVNVGAVAVNDALTSTNFVVEKGSRGSDAVAVDDTGRVLYLGARRLWVFAEGAEGAAWNLADADGNGWTTATLTPDGSDLLAGTGSTGYAERAGAGVVRFDVTARALLAALPGPGVAAGRGVGTLNGSFEAWEGSATAGSVAPIGLSPQGSLVAAVMPAGGTGPQWMMVQAKEPDGRVRTLIRSPGNLSDPVGVATDLADQPSIDVPAPDWPMSDERKVLLAVLSLAAVMLPVWVAVRLRRRRRRPAAV